MIQPPRFESKRFISVELFPFPIKYFISAVLSVDTGLIPLLVLITWLNIFGSTSYSHALILCNSASRFSCRRLGEIYPLALGEWSQKFEIDKRSGFMRRLGFSSSNSILGETDGNTL